MNNLYRNSFELNSKFVNREKYRNNRGRDIEGGGGKTQLFSPILYECLTILFGSKF